MDSVTVHIMMRTRESSADVSISFQSNPYAYVLYDSIWAVALTINKSLSVLNERNLSLINIYPGTGIEIGNVLDEQLSRLSFQGATAGWLEFNHSAAAVQTSCSKNSSIPERTSSADRTVHVLSFTESTFLEQKCISYRNNSKYYIQSYVHNIPTYTDSAYVISGCFALL